MGYDSIVRWNGKTAVFKDTLGYTAAVLFANKFCKPIHGDEKLVLDVEEVGPRGGSERRSFTLTPEPVLIWR